MIKVGFIDYYLDEWHANNYVHMLHDYSNGEVEAVYAWAEIDSPEGGLTTDAWCEKYGLTRMMTQEELIEKSDVLLVLAPRDPKKHEELANLALRSGKRCYVDKTFAPDHFAAKRMLDLAEQSGTPCWSSSALRFAEEYQAADKTNIKGVNAWGPNGFEDYAIHQLEPIFMMMQAPATEVMHLTNDEVYTGVLRFADGRTATLSGYAKGSPFMMNIARSTENSVLEFAPITSATSLRRSSSSSKTAPSLPHTVRRSPSSAPGAPLWKPKRLPASGSKSRRTEFVAPKAVTTHASLTAKGFFQKRDYAAIKEQQVERYGVWLTNFVMIKTI